MQPTSEEELVRIITRAAASGQRVKAVGAGHSFTGLACTEGVLVNLDNMAGLIHVNKTTMTARLRAGTRLRDIPGLLREHGVALANQGDVDPQSVVGAISTGTHGTGLGFTGFAGMVRAFRIITADGHAHECTPEATGTAGELYRLARLSLGAVGIITEVELDVVDTFVLHAVEAAEPIDAVAPHFAQRAAGVDHFEYYWFPGTHVAHTKTNTRLPGTTTPRPLSRAKAMLEDELINNGLYRGLCELTHHVPALTRPLAKVCAATLAQREYSDFAHDVFVTSRRVRFNEMEYAVPLDSATEVLEEITKVINNSDQRVLFPVEVRATAADDVPLSTAKGRQSCYIAIHRYHKDDHRALFRELEPIFTSAGGRPHWGKIHTLTHEELLDRHEDLAEFCHLRETVDPHGMFRNSMVDRVCGLA